MLLRTASSGQESEDERAHRERATAMEYDWHG